MSHKPVDGFSAPLSREEHLVKARAVAAEKRSLSVVDPDAPVDAGVRPSASIKIGNSPLRAIRAQCYDCVCGSSKEIELCPAVECPLYPFRFGKRPATVQRKREKREAAP